MDLLASMSYVTSVSQPASQMFAFLWRPENILFTKEISEELSEGHISNTETPLQVGPGTEGFTARFHSPVKILSHRKLWLDQLSSLPASLVAKLCPSAVRGSGT